MEELDDDDIYLKKFEELDIDGSGSITLDELRVSLFGEASEGDIQFIMSVSKTQLIMQNAQMYSVYCFNSSLIWITVIVLNWRSLLLLLH